VKTNPGVKQVIGTYVGEGLEEFMEGIDGIRKIQWIHK
jgi:hypothetical protein